MKKMFVSAHALLGFAINSNAQATAQASATATIVTPISIVKVVDMNFGNIAVTSSGGTVILSTAGARSTTGGVTLPAVTGTVTAASFTVSGTASFAYNVTLPSSATLSNGGNNMTADVFTSNPSGSNGVLSAGGTQTLAVGSTLHVSAAQPAGVYTCSSFDVTVNYN